MVRIRLMRVGAKGQAIYRIVATDKRKARDARYLEALGYYNPRTQPETIEYREDRMLHWLSVGAQPSEAVAGMLEKMGTQARYERLKSGEDMEALVAEAEAAKAEAEPVSPRTRYPAPAVSKSKTPIATTVEEETEEEAEEEEETVAEAEETAEEAVEEEESGEEEEAAEAAE
jgi:small subunit ribosomal protein S16